VYNYVTGRMVNEKKYTSTTLEEVLFHADRYEGKWIKIPVHVSYIQCEVPSSTME